MLVVMLPAYNESEAVTPFWLASRPCSRRFRARVECCS